MNTTQIYREAVTDKVIDTEIPVNNANWDWWRSLEQTKDFLKILVDEQDKLINRALSNPTTSSNILIEANTINKVLNVTQNGKYENPT